MKRSSTTLALALAMGVAAAGSAQAAPLPQSGERVQIVARDQPLQAFLRDLFGRIGRPVVPSAQLKGAVNGNFDGTVDKVFADVAKAFNLVGYYDGAAVYVYGSGEVTVQSLPGTPQTAQRVIGQVANLRLTDARNLLRASPDGTLVVSGTPRFVEQVSEIARGQQSAGLGGSGGLGGGGTGGSGYGYGAPAPLEFRVFYLRYARAEDTTINAGGREVRVPGLATIVQNLVLDRPPNFGATPVTYGSRPIRQSQPRLRGLGLAAVPGDPSQTSLLQEQRNYLATPMLGLPGMDGAVTADEGFTGAGASADQVRIQANPYLNALIVRDIPERIGAYESLIRALDVEPQLVEVEATIIDININKVRDLGINWRFGSGGIGGLFGSGDADADGRLNRIPGLSRRDNVTNITPSARGGVLSTIIGSNREFIARVTALEAKGAAKIVSRPQIMTMSNVEAVFDRTRTFYVRVGGRQEVDLFNVVAGTVLRVNPHVFRDHDQTRIRVLIGIEDGSITAGEVDDIPIVERSSVSTQAMIVDGESLLLGGMTVDSDQDYIDKIPLLGDIPVLGELFKSRSKSRGRIERLFLITPRVATLTPRLAAATILGTQSAAIPGAPTAAPAAQPAAAPAAMAAGTTVGGALPPTPKGPGR